jgi:hypothetical protein
MSSLGFTLSARLRLLFFDPGATPENRGDKCTDSTEYFHEYKGARLSFQITERARIDRERQNGPSSSPSLARMSF